MKIIHYPFPPPGDAPAPEATAPYPAPPLTSAMDSVITPSGPAAALLSLAGTNGWDGVITHAEGHMPHATHGTPGALKKSEAVRLARGGRRAVAVRMGGAWTSLWTWSGTEFFTRGANLEAFMTMAFGPVSACESIAMGWRALTEPIQSCAVTGMQFVRGSSWGPVQGCEALT